ncbi:lipopolysaccharide biosynthesis protein [Actinospica robiniae]|uniref:lipopolysaccharide biosynthesis protein n=1 Tax=Actinospica robiniae TaxID=304901 RepID=UPI0004263952|nr:lipopolysaccharide biosynthesis protein [Actinospica robiniae]
MARHSRGTMKVLQNSVFLMASTGLTAVLGLLFWRLVAHLFTPTRVGLATSLISAISLISYMSLCGLNSTLIRFPAPQRTRNSQITLSLVAVGGAAFVIASGYLLGLPWYGQKLMFMRDNPGLSALFVGFCVCAALNVITDTVFISARIPQYNLLADGVIQGVAKLVLPLFLVGFGALGIVGATGGGYMIAVVASLTLMWWRLEYRPDFRTRATGLRKYYKFSFASYLSSLIGLLPTLVLPLIVLQRLGADAAAYYYIAFQVSSMLTGVSSGVGESMFSEAAFDLANTAEVFRRSAKIMAIAVVPAGIVLAFGSRLLLTFFGAAYSAHASGLLSVMSVGAAAVALNIWGSSALRVHRRLRAMLVSNAVFLVVAVGLALVMASRGLVWVGWAWDAGNLAAGLVALVCVPWPRREPEPAADAARAAVAEAAEAAEEAAAAAADATEPEPEPEPDEAVAVDATYLDDTLATMPMVFPWNRPEWSAVVSAMRSEAKRPGGELRTSTGMRVRPRPEADEKLEEAGRQW